MRTYALDGLPNDLLTSGRIGERRLKVSTVEIGEQHKIFIGSGTYKPLVGEIIIITQVQLKLPSPSSISINGTDVFNFTTDDEMLMAATYFNGDYVKIDLSKVGSYIRLTEDDEITGGTYLGYYELTQEDSFEDYTVNNELYITDSDVFTVRKPNPYL
jgi:hypothetical protein